MPRLFDVVMGISVRDNSRTCPWPIAAGSRLLIHIARQAKKGPISRTDRASASSHRSPPPARRKASCECASATSTAISLSKRMAQTRCVGNRPTDETVALARGNDARTTSTEVFLLGPARIGADPGAEIGFSPLTFPPTLPFCGRPIKPPNFGTVQGEVPVTTPTRHRSCPPRLP